MTDKQRDCFCENDNNCKGWLTTLAKVQRWVPRSAQGFAESLLTHAKYRPLSAKQLPWVRKLAEQGMDKAPSHALDDIIYNS